MMDTNGKMSSIASAIEAVEAARLDWCRDDKVYAALGVALRSLRATRDKVAKQNLTLTLRPRRT